MSNELQIFNNSQFGAIRTIYENGRALFCAKDVAVSLGYANTNDAINRHCKGVVKRDLPTAGGAQLANFILEGDIYRLAANSELPSADAFESWVFDEVLPSIRKHGMYAVDELLENPDIAIQAFTALKAERERRLAAEAENARQKQIIGELRPKVTYYDIVLNNKGLVTITQIAKDYGMSGLRMNALLHEYGVQYEQSCQWLLYSKYHDKGYTHSQTIPIQHKDGTEDVRMLTKWTQKGRLFLYELLKENGILPIIEQESRSA